MFRSINLYQISKMCIATLGIALSATTEASVRLDPFVRIDLEKAFAEIPLLRDFKKPLVGDASVQTQKADGEILIGFPACKFEITVPEGSTGATSTVFKKKISVSALDDAKENATLKIELNLSADTSVASIIQEEDRKIYQFILEGVTESAQSTQREKLAMGIEIQQNGRARVIGIRAITSDTVAPMSRAQEGHPISAARQVTTQEQHMIECIVSYP